MTTWRLVSFTQSGPLGHGRTQSDGFGGHRFQVRWPWRGRRALVAASTDNLRRAVKEQRIADPAHARNEHGAPGRLTV